MLALWDDYARREQRGPADRSPFETLDDQLPPRVPVDAGYPPLILKRQFVPPAGHAGRAQAVSAGPRIEPPRRTIIP